MTPLVPRKVLFSNPDRSEVKLSFDGRYLSYMGVLDGVRNLFVASTDNPTAAKPLTHDRGRGIRGALWTPTGRHMLYTQDEKGDENYRLFIVDVESGEARCLTPIDKVAASPLATSARHPDEILALLNERDPRVHDVYRINIKTGERVMVCQNPGNLLGFVSDHNLQIIFGQAYQPDGSLILLRRTETGGWTEWQRLAPEDTMSVQGLGLDQTDREFFFLDTRGREFAALVAFDINSGAQRVIAEDPHGDVVAMMFQPGTSILQAVATCRLRREWKTHDPGLAQDLAHLATVVQGDIEVISRSQDDQRWVVTGLSDRSPDRFYLYERTDKSIKFLFCANDALSKYQLSTMHPVVIKARDGLELVSYYLLPPDSVDASGERPRAPLPMALVVHGGPWMRVSWAFEPTVQWLANRGYAVLTVNFRGSTGFGKSFVNAGDRQWGRTMQDDLTDAVKWAVSEKIADPKRVGIIGTSYGGYAVLMGLATTPDLYACGVAMAAPTNLVTLLENQPPYYSALTTLFQKRLGDIKSEAGRKDLLSISPINHLDGLRSPLLIAHGDNDVRVKRDEADSLVKAMQERGLPVTHVVYTGEGHAIARPENGRSFTALTEVFLSHHLGGACEPLGSDLVGASLQILQGEGDVGMEKKLAGA